MKNILKAFIVSAGLTTTPSMAEDLTLNVPNDHFDPSDVLSSMSTLETSTICRFGKAAQTGDLKDKIVQFCKQEEQAWTERGVTKANCEHDEKMRDAQIALNAVKEGWDYSKKMSAEVESYRTKETCDLNSFRTYQGKINDAFVQQFPKGLVYKLGTP